MKTILISLTRGTSARNIMRTRVLKRLLEEPDLQIVVVIPTKIQEYFKKEFEHPRIILEEVQDVKLRRVRGAIIKIYSALIYSVTEYRHLKFGGMEKKPNSATMFLVKNFFFTILSKIKVLKIFARWTEKHIFSDKYYDYLFEKYQPSLLFCTTIYAKLDTMLIKSAKRFGVLSVSLPKSWDTVGRQFFRFPADRLIVNNSFMQKKIIEEQMISADSIYVVGSPQFDIYQNKQKFFTKEEFCLKTGLDVTKPIVLFASEGKLVNWDETYVDDLIQAGLLEKYNLIIRPHFTNSQQHKFYTYKKLKNVYIDDEHARFTNMFHDYWDPTEEDMDWQAEVLHVSDAVIGFMSTFTLDAFVCSRPVINIYYDPKNTEKYVIPMAELYRFPHYDALLAKGAVPLARSATEVLVFINAFVQNSRLFEKEREQVLEELCFMLNGKAGERIANYLLENLH